MRARAFFIITAMIVAAAAWGVTCFSWRFRELAENTGWIEPQSFERLTLVTVGTGTAYENPERLGPSSAVGLGDRVVLVDAGRGIAEALRRARIPVVQPDSVFLTSLAPENTVGLDDLLLTGWLTPRERPLRLVGPPGTVALARGIEQAHAAGIAARRESLALPAEGARFEAIEVGDGWEAKSGELSARAAALPGAPFPVLAWRFEGRGGAVVVAGSGAGSETGSEVLVALARGADAIVQDGFWSESVEQAIEAGADDPDRVRREARLVTPLRRAGEIAQAADVDLLVLVRLRPPPIVALPFEQAVGEVYDGRVLIAEDGQVVTLRSRGGSEGAP